MRNTRKVHQIYVIFVYIRTFLAFFGTKKYVFATQKLQNER